MKFGKIFWSIFLLLVWPLSVFSGQFGLISAQKLQQMIKNRKAVVLDARPQALYLKGHIPSAVSFSWEKYTYTDDQGVKYRLLPPEELSRILGRLGVSETSTVVAYGDAASSWGGEGWILWVLEYLGHKGKLLLLDGGLKAWKEAGFPLVSGLEPPPKKAEYHLHLKKEINCDASWLERHLAEVNLVDTRSLPEYLSGHLPGAIFIPWKAFLRKDGYLKPREEIVSLLRKKGVKPSRLTVFYCTGGVRSGFAYSVYRLFDLGPAKNFEGGTEEWFRRSRKSK